MSDIEVHTPAVTGIDTEADWRRPVHSVDLDTRSLEADTEFAEARELELAEARTILRYCRGPGSVRCCSLYRPGTSATHADDLEYWSNNGSEVLLMVVAVAAEDLALAFSVYVLV